MDATYAMNLEEKVDVVAEPARQRDRGRDLRPAHDRPAGRLDVAGPDRARGDDDPARHRHPLPAPARQAERLRLLRPAGTAVGPRRRPLPRAAADRPAAGGALGRARHGDERRRLQRPLRAHASDQRVGRGLDVLTKTPQPALAPAALEQPLGIEGTLMRQLPPPLVRPADTGLPRTAELQRAAQAIVDRSTWSVFAEGTVGPRRPGAQARRPRRDPRRGSALQRLRTS